MSAEEQLLLSALGGAVVLIPPSLLLARYGARLTWDELGFTPPRPGRGALWGLIVGMLVLLVPAAFGYLFGAFSSTPTSNSIATAGLAALPGIVVVLPALLIASFTEELVLRGFLLQFGRRYLGKWGALATTSVLFALLHVGNPAASGLGITGAAIAGLWLGLAFLESGSLFFATGLHLGWNAASAVVLGLPVSGLALPSLLRWIPSPALSTQTLWGGAYGPEEGVVFHAALGIASVICVWLARRI